MGKKKIKDAYPFPGSLFTVSELAYITAAVKMIPYEVDYDKATINVPASEIEKAEDNLTVRHLQNMYGFTVQQHIDYKPARKVFDPPLLSSNKGIIMFKVQEKEKEVSRGDHFKDVRNNRVIKVFNESSDKKNLTMMIVGSMEPNFTISKISAEISLKNKLWIPISIS